MMLLLLLAGGTTATAQQRADLRWAAGGHRQDLYGMAFSPDGQLAASASIDATVKIWRVADGALLHTFTDPVGLFLSVSFSPDGADVIATGVNGATQWRLSDGQAVRNYCCMETGSATAFSPDGELVAVGGSATGFEDFTLIFRTSDGSDVRTLSVPGRGVIGLAFTPDSQRIIAAGGGEFGVPAVVRVWRISDGAELDSFSDHTDQIFTFDASADNTLFATGSRDTTIAVRDTVSGALVQTLVGHSDGVLGVAFSPDGQRLASSSVDGTIRVWEIASGAEIFQISEPGGAVAWSPDGQLLLSGSRTDFAVKTWDAATGQPLAEWTQFRVHPGGLGVAADGSRVAGGAYDGLAKVFDSDGALLRTFDVGVAVTDVALSPHGATLATMSTDKLIRVFDVQSGALLDTLTEMAGVPFTPNRLEYSADGQLIAAGLSGEPLRLWRTSDGGLDRMIGASSAAFALSPDGQFAALGTSSGASVFRISDGGLHGFVSGHASSVLDVAFSADSQLLATSSSDRTAKIWRVADGALLHTLSGHGDWVRAVAFAPGGATVATASSADDRSLRLWNVDDGSLLTTYESDIGGGPSHLVFSPDGCSIVARTTDGSLLNIRNPFARLTGDLDGNASVDLDDLTLLLQNFASGPAGDIDGDGDTDLDDLTALLQNFGTACP